MRHFQVNGVGSARLREAVHYVCRKYASDTQKLGAVKLQKVIWYFDVRNYAFKEPSTGATFIKGAHGPYTLEIGAAVKELVRSDRLFTDTEQFFDNEKARFIGKGQSDLSAFSERQRRWLDEISTDICESHTADSISERSHGPIWKMAEYGETIPFEATVIRLRKPSQAAVEAMKKELGLA